MSFEHLLHNFFAPPVPFFFIGLIAIILKSDLEIPAPISKFISLYLLMSIGFKGGVELHESGLNGETVKVILCSIIAALLIPYYCFYILRKKLDVANAAALSAAFGSVSVVTFLTASNILQISGIPYGGQMIAAMALMESPSIIVGVLLYRKYSKSPGAATHVSAKELFREAFLNGSIVVLMGSLTIGLISNDTGMEIMQPFTGSIFKGMLSFFLLDMGVLAGKRIGALKGQGWFLFGFGIGMPLLNAFLGIVSAHILGLDQGNAFMLTVLFASASYVAVPAAMRMAIPEANPGIYVPVALGVTFPFNIIVGLPLYYYVLQLLHT